MDSKILIVIAIVNQGETVKLARILFVVIVESVAMILMVVKHVYVWAHTMGN